MTNAKDKNEMDNSTLGKATLKKATLNKDTLDKDVLSKSECLFANALIESKIVAMAEKITESAFDKNPIFICIMNGGLPFSASLIQKFNFPLELDYLHLSRYQGKVEGSTIQWFAKPQSDLRNRYVVLMDDILDIGISLQAAKQYCLEQGALQVQTAVLLKKDFSQSDSSQNNQQVCDADYVGLLCPDRYVFGFGMDYKNYYRNLDAIYALKE